jgi:hypothetical protein
MAATVPDRNKDSKRNVDMNNPCPSCGMIHVDPNFDYEKHAKQTNASRVIGQALFGKN